ncbi:hypothetical protein DM2_1900 [Halorubrum sp. DM2]|nr:hypothetical protein DM2_1900 [Halorubrum sp. DM2]
MSLEFDGPRAGHTGPSRPPGKRVSLKREAVFRNRRREAFSRPGSR